MATFPFTSGLTAYQVYFNNTANSGGNFTSSDAYDAIVEARNVVQNAEDTVTGATTTTSATDVVLGGLSVTPIAGTYVVMFSGWFSTTNGGASTTLSIYAGAAQNTNSVRVIVPRSTQIGSTSQDACGALHGTVTVNGSQAITIQWHTSAGTTTCTQATMDLLRVA